jgi:hypothetical protein
VSKHSDRDDGLDPPKFAWHDESPYLGSKSGLRWGNAVRYAFISYFREDKGAVDKFVKRLERAGVSCWIDRRGLEIGHEWKAMIRRKIFDADAFVLFISKQYERKHQSFLREELKIACERLAQLDRTVTWIYPVSLDGEPIPSLPISSGHSLSNYQAIFANRGLDKAANQLGERVSSFLRDPKLNQARMTIKAVGLGFKTPLLIDGKVIGVEVPENGRIDLAISPGEHELQLSRTHVTYLPGGGGNPVSLEYHSNKLRVKIRARDNLQLVARQSRRTGLLWMNKETPENMVLEQLR